MGGFKGSLYVAGLLALFAGLSLNQGCNGKTPALPVVLAPAPPALGANVISDFETGHPTLNPLLQGSANGIWRAATFKGPAYSPNKVPSQIVVPNTVADANDGSLFAIHLEAVLLAAGNYESDQLICPLYNANTGAYYDASSFTGIAFMINLQPDDSNINPILQVAIDQTTPPAQFAGTAGGTCLYGSQCYNHYQILIDYNTLKGTGWQPVTAYWPSFYLPFAASQVNPPNLDQHLDKFIFLQWQFSNNVQGAAFSPVSTYTNFWIDNVQFLP